MAKSFLIIFIGLFLLQVPFCAESSAANRAAYFTGAGDHISFTQSPSLNELNAFTIEAWIYFEVGGTENPRIFSKGWEAQGGVELLLLGTGESRKLMIAAGAGINSRTILNLTANKWYHVAVGYDLLGGYLMVDGSLDSTFTTTLHASNKFPGELGRNSLTGSDHFKGYLDDVRVWNRKLTFSEIQSNKSVVLNGNEPGLVACWNFDNDTGNDVSPNANDGSLTGVALPILDLPVETSLSIYTAIEVQMVVPAGHAAHLQVSSNLLNWTDSGTSFSGTGAPQNLLFSTRNRSSLYYRLKP